MGFVEAEREQVRAQIAIMGPSGSGKTVGALKIAYGMTGDWKKIGVVDTEHDRSKVYVGTKHTGGEQIGKFMHMRLEPPYKAEKFSTAIDEAVEAGLEVIIFDSFSHEWEGVGGIVDWKNELGEGFTHWKKPKKAHSELLDKIMHAPINVITTIRTKQEYVVIPGGGKDGKSSVEKLGMKPVQSGDIDYEFLLAFTVDMDNRAEATKDNTGLFGGTNIMLNEDHGRMLKEWIAEGKEVDSVVDQNKAKEAKRQELIAYFTEQRNATPKAQSWYTQKEIAAGVDIPDWSLEVLEKLYNQLKEAAEKKKQKQQQQEAPPESKQEEQPPEEHKPGSGKLDRKMIIAEIVKLRAIPEVDKMAQEYLEKSKVSDLTQLRDEQIEFLMTITQRRAKTAQEQKGA